MSRRANANPGSEPSARERGQALLDDLAEPYVGRDGVDRSRMFGSLALRRDGKIVAFVAMAGELVVKVPAERAEALVADAVVTPMTIGRHPAKEWVGVPLERDDLWPDLLAESYDHVGSR